MPRAGNAKGTQITTEMIEALLAAPDTLDAAVSVLGVSAEELLGLREEATGVFRSLVEDARDVLDARQHLRAIAQLACTSIGADRCNIWQVEIRSEKAFLLAGSSGETEAARLDWNFIRRMAPKQGSATRKSRWFASKRRAGGRHPKWRGTRAYVPVFVDGRIEAIGELYWSDRQSFVGIGKTVSLLNELIGNALEKRQLARQSRIAEESAAASRTIDSIIDGLTGLERRARDVCKKLQERFGYDFVAIQWIGRDSVIETIGASGVAESWARLAKHRLATEPKLRDIQADIVMQRRAEVLSGQDGRFDPFLFELYGHVSFSRVFAPLILFRDGGGQVVRDPESMCEWQDLGRGKYEMKVSPGLEAKVIGTIEAGFVAPEASKDFRGDEVMDLLSAATAEVADLYEATFESALEQILEKIMKVARADSAVLHLGDPATNTAGPELFSYNVCCGCRTHSVGEMEGGIGAPPRAKGLGGLAMTSGRPQCVPDPRQGHGEAELLRQNRNLWSQGVRATAAYPLYAGERRGIVYLHYRYPHTFTEGELESIDVLAKRCAEAIRIALDRREERDRFQRFLTLQNVAHAVLRNEGDKLAKELAWYTLYLLAADVVTLHMRDPNSGEFSKPITAGKLLSQLESEAPSASHDAPGKVVRNNKPVWASDTLDSENSLLRVRGRHGGRGFVDRENIVSAAAVPLRSMDQKVRGVMFINYRLRHEFREADKEFILALSDWFGYALGPRRGTTDADLRRITDPVAAAAIAPQQKSTAALV